MGRSDWDYSGHHPRHVGLFVAGQDWELPPGTMPLVLPPLAGRYPRCNRREDLEVLILRCRPFPTVRTKVPLGGFKPSTLQMQDERSNYHTIALSNSVEFSCNSVAQGSYFWTPNPLFYTIISLMGEYE